MKKLGSLALSGLLLLSVSQVACKKKQPEAREWYRYISAFTSGDISRKAPVRVLFVGNVGSEGQDPAQLADYLQFTPALDGKTEWKSARELVFTPDRQLAPGQSYRAVLNTKKFM